MLRTILLAATAALVFVTPASSSFGIWFTGPEGVSFEAPLSGGAGLSVWSAKVEAAGRIWSTEAAREDPQAIVPAQSWDGRDFMWFDFADPSLESNVVEVRISLSDEVDAGGTLEIIGVGSWDGTCDLG